MKVVIAIDSSNWAAEAFDWYVQHVHCPKNQVVLYHFVEPPVVHGDDYGNIAEIYAAEIKGCHVIAKDIVEAYEKKLEANQINGKFVVQFSGRPGEAIIQAAKTEEAQMIVIGTRGLGTVRRTLLGSVSVYVVHHAHCPVAVCSHPPRKRRLTHTTSESSEGYNDEPVTPTSPIRSPFAKQDKHHLTRQLTCPQ